jgi:hypothetical protein
LKTAAGFERIKQFNNSEGRPCALAAFATMPPYLKNLRLVKSPEEAYLGDSGFVCYLVGLTSMPEVERSPFLGPLLCLKALWQRKSSTLRRTVECTGSATISATSRVWK